LIKTFKLIEQEDAARLSQSNKELSVIMKMQFDKKF